MAGAIVGSAVIGGVAASSSASKAQKSADNATAAQSAAAKDSTAVAQERLDFEKQQYADSKDYRTTAADTANKVSQQQLTSAKQQDDLAREYNDYRKTTFQPLEQKIVTDATNYASPDRINQAASSAIGDVNIGFSQSADAQGRRLSASGINPGSARAIAALGGSSVNQALASAGAAYSARKGVQDQATVMQLNAASLGRNLPANQNASANTALQAGNSAANNALIPVSVSQTPAGLQNAYAGLSSANLGAASIYGQQANTFQNVVNAGNSAWGQLGSVAGQIGTRYLTGGAGGAAVSDENVKEGIRPTSGADALDAVNDTDVKRWRYSPAKLAEQGILQEDAPPGEHIGPMAQDVQRTMGNETAPDGKRIDMISMAGVNMKATQALSKKVDRMGKQMARMASRGARA